LPLAISILRLVVLSKTSPNKTRVETAFLRRRLGDRPDYWRKLALADLASKPVEFAALDGGRFVVEFPIMTRLSQYLLGPDRGIVEGDFRMINKENFRQNKTKKPFVKQISRLNRTPKDKSERID